MYSQDRKQLVETTTISVFESMLHMAVWPVDSPANPDDIFCTARVRMLCQPAIEVHLHLLESQALALAARLMGIPQPTSVNEDVCDAMREVINVVGGNLKASLAEGKQLTIAEVLASRDLPISQPSVELFPFDSEWGVFWISLDDPTNNFTNAPQEEALLAS